MRNPNWFMRKLRRLFGRCPYCNKKMKHGVITVFLNGFYGCPDGHYVEETVWAAGGAVLIYENCGKNVFPTIQPPAKPVLRIVNGGR